MPRPRRPAIRSAVVPMPGQVMFKAFCNEPESPPDNAERQLQCGDVRPIELCSIPAKPLDRRRLIDLADIRDVTIPEYSARDKSNKQPREIIVKAGVMTAVLRKIAEFHWKHGDCRASVETIARQTKFPVITVRRAIAGLEYLSLLVSSEREGQFRYGRYGTRHRAPNYQRLANMVSQSANRSPTNEQTPFTVCSLTSEQTQSARSSLTSEHLVCSLDAGSSLISEQQSEWSEKQIKERQERSADRMPVARSPLHPPTPERNTPLELSTVDCLDVIRMAEAVGRRIPPKSDDDRRAWFKFAVMAQMTFSEAWLMDAVEAVLQAPKSHKSQQAHLVAVLKSKAQEQGVPSDVFLGIFRRIEIPIEIWNSDALKCTSRKIRDRGAFLG